MKSHTKKETGGMEMTKIFEHGSSIRENREPLLVTRNSVMKKLCSRVEMVAETSAPVLITGESGTGKEVIARMIHNKSERSNNEFVAMNCGALPNDIVESELFGHEEGAFTGAVKQKQGCFELANQGTLFLDEVAEMNPDMQVKFLRAVELGSFRRLGGQDEISVNTRLISATNQNLKKALNRGTFREDLFYRLGVIQLTIPPLRSRKDDIPILTRYFLNMFRKKYDKDVDSWSEQFMEKMLAYDWPGNVRELKNVMERCLIMAHDEVLTDRNLPAEISDNKRNSDPFHYENGHINVPIGASVEEAEKSLIKKTLASVDDNISEAARILGYSRATLYKKLESYER